MPEGSEYLPEIPTTLISLFSNETASDIYRNYIQGSDFDSWRLYTLSEIRYLFRLYELDHWYVL